ncbi:MAG: DUF4345 domain-containing protein [Deltaproteobacteria bacterium]|nr:DUF4345 domain-containing protein [Deltaproteobacteria bacterium]
MPRSSELIWFQRVCRGIACIPVLVGSTVALTGGAGLDLVFGLDLGKLDPSLESHVRFLAANFAAMGLVFVWGTGDVLARRAVLRIFFGTFLVGAAVRMMAIAVHGAPSMMTLLVIAGELSACPLWLWHARILRQLRQST